MVLFMVIVVVFFSQEAEVGNFAASSSLPWKLLYIQIFFTAAAHSVLELCHCTLASVCCDTFGMTFICTNWGSCPDILKPWLLSWFRSRRHIIFVQNVFFSHSLRWCLKWAFRLNSSQHIMGSKRSSKSWRQNILDSEFLLNLIYCPSTETSDH